MKLDSLFSPISALKLKSGRVPSLVDSYGGQKYTENELAFLPAALEIIERPPAPAAGVLSATIIGLFCLVLIWACFGKVDVVAIGNGKVVPSGRTKVLQPFEAGVVRAIHVSDGQKVRAGDLLIELDSTMNSAERDHLRSDLVVAQLNVARLTAALSDAADPLSVFDPPHEASPSLVAMQRQLLSQQIEEYRASIGLLERQKSGKQAELATIQATVAKLEAMLPVLQQRVDIRNTLYSHETGSKANYLEILQSLVEMQQDLLIQKSRSTETQAALAAIEQSQTQKTAEFHRRLYEDLVEAQRKAAGLKEDVIRAEQRAHFQRLTAPVDGSVQQLAVHTIGGVVTPAQPLLIIVPENSHLEIEALVSNRDIGFVHPGQEVEIKVDTFNFTRYGLLRGKILSVSRDAIARDVPEDSSANIAMGIKQDENEPRARQLNYAARISLDQTQMDIDGKSIDLSAGMAVTVEIKTGSRRVIEYLLSPLLRYKQESFHER